MNTRIYEYLMAVAEYKNISQAAQQCFISQPALTQHIKKLEKQLGTPVFEKKRKASGSHQAGRNLSHCRQTHA